MPDLLPALSAEISAFLSAKDKREHLIVRAEKLFDEVIEPVDLPGPDRIVDPLLRSVNPSREADEPCGRVFDRGGAGGRVAPAFAESGPVPTCRGGSIPDRGSGGTGGDPRGPGGPGGDPGSGSRSGLRVKEPIMPQAQDILGTVFKNGSAVFLARVVGGDGMPVTQLDISSAKYSVYLLDEDDADAATAVVGHQDVALAVSAVIYDTLQTGGLWDKDSVGYNFRHVLDVSQGQAFGTAGRVYRAVYELTPVSGQVTVVRFKVRAI